MCVICDELYFIWMALEINVHFVDNEIEMEPATTQFSLRYLLNVGAVEKWVHSNLWNAISFISFIKIHLTHCKLSESCKKLRFEAVTVHQRSLLGTGGSTCVAPIAKICTNNIVEVSACHSEEFRNILKTTLAIPIMDLIEYFSSTSDSRHDIFSVDIFVMTIDFYCFFEHIAWAKRLRGNARPQSKSWI